MGGAAWVTLATNDSYSLGALVLAHSLKQTGTTQQLAVLITPGVTNAMREKLSSVFDVVKEVNILDSKDEANLRLLKRPELGITFTKLHCWRLTQFDKCVFLDADTLVLRNCDELFDREEFSAAPDVGWPDCFNSGVFVFRPSIDTYEKLIQFALEKGSFDGGDQGLLNLYFSDWAHKDINKHLPFIYNLCSTACYSYLPAFKQFGGNAKIIHFIGTSKPWLQYFDTERRQVVPSADLTHLRDVLQKWWEIFCSFIHPGLSREMAGLAGAFAQLTLGVPRTAEQIAVEDILRRQAWEVGNIDYLGRDSFENIWSKISATLSLAPEPALVEQPKEEAAVTSSEEQTTESQPEAVVAGDQPAVIDEPLKTEPETTTEIKEQEKTISAESKTIEQSTPVPVEAQQTSPVTQDVTPTPDEVKNIPEEVAATPQTPSEVPLVQTPAEVSKTPEEIQQTEVPLTPTPSDVTQSSVVVPKTPETVTPVPTTPEVVTPLPKSPEAITLDPQTPTEISQPETVEAPKEQVEVASKEVVEEKVVEDPKEVGDAPKNVEEEKVAPQTPEITEATPPTSPPLVEEEKQTRQQVLAVDTSIPDTPPPEGEASPTTPTPPPRKSSGPKKSSAKPKK